MLHYASPTLTYPLQSYSPPIDHYSMNTQSTIMTQTISYDFIEDNTCIAVAQVLELSRVTPNSITFNNNTFNNVTIEFNTTNDAIRFTKVYLGDDCTSSDIMEYVVDDTIAQRV